MFRCYSCVHCWYSPRHSKSFVRRHILGDEETAKGVLEKYPQPYQKRTPERQSTAASFGGAGRPFTCSLAAYSFRGLAPIPRSWPSRSELCFIKPQERQTWRSHVCSTTTGPTLEAVSASGQELLWVAARLCKEHVVWFLLAVEANPESLNTKANTTALHEAVQCAIIRLARLLLENSADVDTSLGTLKAPVAHRDGFRNAERYKYGHKTFRPGYGGDDHLCAFQGFHSRLLLAMRIRDFGTCEWMGSPSFSFQSLQFIPAFHAPSFPQRRLWLFDLILTWGSHHQRRRVQPYS